MKNQLLYLCLLLLSITHTKAQDYPEMISVEGGTFTMGDTEMEGEKDEQPAHEVTLKSFKIAKTETTVAQWKAYCRATGRKMPEAPSWGWIDTHPIVNVNYDDAVGYCDWLSETKDANYRLPTEAEWEFAARGGRKSKNYRFAGSNNHHEVVSNIFRSEPEGDFRGSGEMKKVMPVKQSIPNELGIYDMSGNVWEFCQDWYQADYYQKSEKKNPRGPLEDTQYHTIRGSFWDFEKPEDNCGVANRSNIHHSMRAQKLGFRLVRSVHQN